MTRVFSHVKQSDDHTCGPAVVAIVTGASYAQLVRELRATPKRGVRHRHLIEALRSRGVRCADRFTHAGKRPLPEVCVARVVFPSKVGHVVVKSGTTWFDPLLDAPFAGTLPTDRAWSGGGRVTSFLEIFSWRE